MGLIPQAFADTTTAREGNAGRAWLADLPEIAADVQDQWDCTQDGDTMHGEVGIGR